MLPQLRLDDFWQLRLCKPNPSQLLQQCRLEIRIHHFREMAQSDSIAALQYLQTTLSDVIDHTDPQQTNKFQSLASELFCDSTKQSFLTSTSSTESEKEFKPYESVWLKENKCYFQRSQLFEKLMQYFPENMRQPKGNLTELLRL